MGRSLFATAMAIALCTSVGTARQAGNDGPYKVLKTAKVGGEGGSDYIYADVAGRRLYIPRGGTRAVAATDTTPAVPAVPGRITVFNLDTLEPVGEIPGTGGNGVVVDPKSGHGFSSSKPVTMFDTKTLKLIKAIDVGAAFGAGGTGEAFLAPDPTLERDVAITVLPAALVAGPIARERFRRRATSALLNVITYVATLRPWSSN